MQRLGICEEGANGWDKVAFQIEYFQLQAPRDPRDPRDPRLKLICRRVRSSIVLTSDSGTTVPPLG